ncbi:hypothetical protein SO078_03525 [Sinorhizobium meliloti]|nr:hypothetical protein [Sinorhizobium meliloti]WRQ68307.1 hypothetical protein SO078_03525 [Sinorhizobium meliloti]
MTITLLTLPCELDVRSWGLAADVGTAVMEREAAIRAVAAAA